ncbi:MAG: hypothetical protein ABIN01_05470 [Ferruginibacter sp.]
MSTNWQVSSMLESLFTGNNENPFVGLRPYEPDEGHLFFGRDTQIKDLLQKLHSKHFLAIVGSSGCGKSSLIRAGVIPKLKGGFLTNERDHWLVAKMRPSGSPLQCLSHALKDAFDSDQSGIQKPDIDLTPENIVKMGTFGFVEKMRVSFQDSRFNLLILVDQFEELFTYEVNNESQRNENVFFVNLLLSLAHETTLPVYTIITMRSDYIGHCNRFFGLPEVLNESQYLVPRLKWQQIREVIEFPIKLYSQQINSGLLDLLTNDSDKELDQLPVLQHCLMRMYSNWIADGKKGQIEFKHYEQTGGLNGSICKHANEVYNELDAKQQRVAEYIFKAITDFNAQHEPIRRPQKFDRILAICAAVKDSSRQDVLNVINKFRKKSCAFLTPYEDVIEITDTSVIDISHESLMRQWDLLNGDVSRGDIKNGWMKQEQRSADKLYWLSESVTDKREYLRGWDIKNVLKWREKQNPNDAWAERYVDNLPDVKIYIEKSITNNKKRNFLVYGSTVLGLIGIFIAAFNYSSAKAKSVALLNETTLRQAAQVKADSANVARTQAMVAVEKAQANAAQATAAEAQAIANVQKAQAEAAQARADADIQAAQARANQIEAQAKLRALPDARKEILALTRQSFYQSNLIPQDTKDMYVDRLIQMKYELKDESQFKNLLSDLNSADTIKKIAQTDPNRSLLKSKESYELSKSKFIDSILKDVANNYLFYIHEINLKQKYNAVKKIITAVSKDKKHFAIRLGDTIKIGSIKDSRINWHNDILVKTEENSNSNNNKLYITEDYIPPHLTFTDDNHLVALITNTIYKWDLNGKQEGEPLLVAELGDSRRYTTAISPDGKALAIDEKDYNVKVWNIGTSLASPQLIELNKKDGYVDLVAFSPDSKKLMVQQGTKFNFFSSSDLKQINFTGFTSFAAKVSYANFLSGGNYIIGVFQDTMISIFDSSGKTISSIPNPVRGKKIIKMLLSPDWKKLLIKTSNPTSGSNQIYFVTKNDNNKDSLFSLNDKAAVSFVCLKQVVPVTGASFDLVSDNNLLGTTSNYNGAQIRLWKNYPLLSFSKDVTAMINDMSATSVSKRLEANLVNINTLSEKELEAAAEDFTKQYDLVYDNKSLMMLKSIYGRLLSFNEGKYLEKYKKTARNFFNYLGKDTAQYINELINLAAIEERLLNSSIGQSVDSVTLLKYNLAQDYGNLAWYSLFQKKPNYKNIQSYAKRGIAVDSAQDWIYTNLVLAYLFDHKFKEADAIYMKFKSQKKVYDGLAFKDAFLQDFEDLEKAGIISPKDPKINNEVSRIKMILKSEK